MHPQETISFLEVFFAFLVKWLKNFLEVSRPNENV